MINQADTAFHANYHTHTPRCRHASGAEREYIENAIAAGMTTLGFSDHTPYFFERDYYSNFRMFPENFPGYFETLASLKEEYRGRIDILIGLETEYYPKHFGQLLDFIAPYQMDYLILGQHFTNNEYDGVYSGDPTDDERILAQYTEQVIEALHTGKFAYLAHPELLNFTGDRTTYRRWALRLCEEAKALGIPLEINFLGFAGRRWYPREDFLAVAGETGCTVIFGCDAHSPDVLPNMPAFEGCMRLTEKYGLERTEKIALTLRK